MNSVNKILQMFAKLFGRDFQNHIHWLYNAKVSASPKRGIECIVAITSEKLDSHDRYYHCIPSILNLFTHQLQLKQNSAKVKRILSEAWENYNGEKRRHTHTHIKLFFNLYSTCTQASRSQWRLGIHNIEQW